jgi:hypothetical protein
MDTEAIIKQLDSFQVRLFRKENGLVVPNTPPIIADPTPNPRAVNPARR